MKKLWISALAVLTSLLIAGLTPLSAQLGEVWEWQNPLPQGNSLHAVTDGNGLFVAVGEAGTVLTSANGENWESQDIGSTESLHEVLFGDGRFVAVGENGNVFTSPDGVSWTEQNVGMNIELFGVTHGSTGYVAVGANGSVFKSDDAITWTLRPSETTSALRAVAFHDGTYVAVGASGTIVTSIDGETWTAPISGINNQLNAVAFLTTTSSWIAVGSSGSLVTSQNGTDWTTPTQATVLDLWGISSVAGNLVAVGELGITLQSENGSDWNQVTSGFNTKLEAVAVLGSTMVAVGEAGVILTTTDASDWNKVSVGHNAFLVDVHYEDGLFVAVGTVGRIYTSTDGREWTQRSSLTSAGLWDTAFGQDSYVVVGNSGTIRHSIDGKTWEATMFGTNHHISGVAYGNDQFVAVGRAGLIRVSPDGNIWQDAAAEGISDWLEDIYFRDGQFIITGRSGQILTSEDPLTGWTSQTSGVNTNLLAVTYGAGRYISVGNSGTILSSIDGITWNQEDSETISTLNNIVFDHDLFVAVGSAGTILTSPDGTTWTMQNSGTLTDLWGIEAAPGIFIATGDNGVVLRSGESGPPVDGLLFSQWVTQNNIPNGQRGISDSPAHDGIPNLVKFALGLDPLTPQRDKLPTLEIIEDGGQSYLALNLTEATDIYGAQLSLEVSTNLIDWSDAPSSLQETDTISENLRSIRLTENTAFMEGDRRFIRLKVVLDETPPTDPEPNSFEGWAITHNLPTGQSGPLDTPAGDGVANVLKYAFGIDPLVYTNPADLPQQGTIEAGGETYMTLTYIRSTTITGVSFVLEGSGDFKTWETITNAETNIESLPGDREKVTLVDIESFETTGRRFLRLRVILDGTPPTDPETDTFAGWASDHNIPSGQSGPTDTPAGDGVKNILKYAFGIDPMVYTNRSSLHEQGEIEVDGETFMTVTYTRSTTATGISFALKGSADFMIWETITTAETDIVTLPDGREKVTLVDTEPMETTGRRFLKIAVLY